MKELEYCNLIILVEIEKIQESLIDLSNAHKISQLESITEIYSSLSIIKLYCKRLLEIINTNKESLNKIIDTLDGIYLYGLINYEDSNSQFEAIINLSYSLGIIITLFDNFNIWKENLYGY